jgi:hypothetical protein
MNDDSSAHESDCNSVERKNADKNSGKQGTDSAGQSQPVGAPIAGAKPQTPPAPTQRTQSDCQTGKRHTEPPNWCEITMLAAEIIGIAGLVWYCIINLHELSVFRDESKTMQNEFLDGQTNAVIQLQVVRDQLDAIQTQSGIMQRQLDEMKRTSQLDERAWVNAFQLNRRPFGNTTDFVYFVVSFKNTGKTPAIDTRAKIYEAFSLDNVPPKDPQLPIGGALLPPGVDCNVTTANQPMYIKTFQDIYSGKMDFYMYGTVWYNDISGHPHWSQFCWIVDLKYTTFLPAPIHNSCDDAQTNQTN